MAREYSFGNVTVKLEGLEEALNALDPQPAQLAARASLERVANSGKGSAVDLITSVYNVKKSVLNTPSKKGDARIVVSTPRTDNLVARITFQGRGISLAYFGAKQLTGTAIKSRGKNGIQTKRLSKKARAAGPVPQGVMVQVLKGGDSVLLRNAFLAKMPNGHIAVMRRGEGAMKTRGAKYGANKHTAKIYEKSVVSIATMVENEKVMPRLIEQLQARWDVEFPRQLAYYQGRRR